MASGRINGTCTGTAGSKYNLWVEWSSTVDVPNNRSLVTATEYVQRNDGYSASAYNLNASKSNKKITIGSYSATASTDGIDTRNNAKFQVVKYSHYISHDSNGKKTVSITAKIPYVTAALSGGSVSGSAYLDEIDVNPLVISNWSVNSITQNTAHVSWSIDSTADWAMYSLNGAAYVNLPINSVITGLSPNTNYSLRIKLRKKSNQKWTESTAVNFTTLPIYVTEIQYPDHIDMDVGESVTILPTILPENASIKTVNLSANVSNILEISGNTITALSKGYVSLTISAADGSGVEVETAVNVYTAVSGVEVNPNSLTIAKGETFTVPYRIIPDNADIRGVWITSSDSEVVSISDNQATAVENGQAIITVTTVDGEFTATMLVNVVGDYTWYDYSAPIEILNSEDIAHIDSNIKTIRAMLLAGGYTIDSLSTIDKEKNTQFYKIFDILQNIEYNLDRINSTEIKSIYYGAPVIVGNIAENREQIWRWIQILNDLYNVLNGTFGRWSVLLCLDGYPTIDDKKILIRGDVING